MVLGAYMSESQTIEKGTYRHNKSGKLYKVIGVALQTETNEALVIYQPLYQSEYKLYARPYQMFIEQIELNGQQTPRFEYIGA